MTMVPTSANIKSYANIVSEKAVLRRLIKTTEEIAGACYAGKEPLENILADTEKSVFDLFRIRAGRNLYPSSRLPSMFWKRSRMHIKTRERLPVSLPDLLIWIINCPVSSLPILS